MDRLTSEFDVLPAIDAGRIFGGEDTAPFSPGALAIPAGAYLMKLSVDYVNGRSGSSR